MPRTAARFTKAELTRALKAAREAGVAGVEIDGGTIRLLLQAQDRKQSPHSPQATDAAGRPLATRPRPRL